MIDGRSDDRTHVGRPGLPESLGRQQPLRPGLLLLRARPKDAALSAYRLIDTLWRAWLFDSNQSNPVWAG
jgi:hypothetical protein